MELISNRYRIIRGIGSGSLGSVYLVTDTRGGDEICLKVLQDPSSTRLDDLRREFRLLSQLRHPALIRVLDFGTDPEYGPYFTMEYAPRGDLRQVTGLSPQGFAGLASSLCSALEFIHSRNILHGDIKPSNILRDSSDNFILTDFGLSFVRGEGKDKFSAGTLAYVAPEVLSRGTIDRRSDIYSLGLVFCELISGVPLYEGDAGRTVNRKLSEPIEAPTIPLEFGGDRMRAVLARMLQVDPQRRYKSAGEVLDEIVSILREELFAATGIGQVSVAAGFVGRQKEIKWLEDGLQSFLDGECPRYFIGGDSGVGKSRLLDELRIRAQIRGLGFYKSECLDTDMRSFGPISRLLHYLLSEVDPGGEVFDRFGPDLRRFLPGEGVGVPAGLWQPSESDIRAVRRRMFDNFLLYLNELNKRHGMILAVEDVHRADPETLEFLEFLWESGDQNMSIYLICTGETGPDQKIESFFTRNEDAFRILEPANDDLLKEFLAGLLGAESPPADLSSTLLKETGGNFLFAEETIKELVSNRSLARERGAWTLKDGWSAEISLPHGVSSILSRRLERLNRAQESLVTTAAVLGRAFAFEEIAALTGLGDIGAIVDSLIDFGILNRQRDGKDEKIGFRHGQIRHTAYERISHPRKRRIHKVIADFYASSGESDDFLGRHYTSAHEYEKGYLHITEAAKQAEGVLAFARAAELYGAGLRCLEGLGPFHDREKRLLSTYLGQGRALNYVSPKEARSPLSRALEMARSLNLQGPEMVELLVIAGRNSLDLGNGEQAAEMFESGRELAGTISETRLQAECQVGLGFVYDKTGRLEEAEMCYRQALDLFEEAEFPEGSCRVLNYLGIISKRHGDLDSAGDFYRRALFISLENDFKWVAMNLYGNLGNLYSSRNQPEEAGRYYSESLRIARELSDRRIESINLLNIGHAYNQSGDLDRAESSFFEALSKLRSLGDKGSEAITLNNLGYLYFRRGEISRSIDNYMQGLELGRLINQPRIELANLVGLAETKAAIADFTGADDAASQALALAERTEDVEQLAAILSIRAETKYELGDLSLLKESCERLRQLPEQVGQPGPRVKALILASLFAGDADAARKTLEEEIERLTGSSTAAELVAVRLRTQFALNEGKISNPEIWIARLGEAARKAAENFLHGESLRLTALRIRALEAAGDNLGASRQKEQLLNEISRLMTGMQEREITGLEKYLDEKAPHGKEGEKVMGKASREERLEVLLRIARTINTIRESDPLLDKIMDLALETLGGERGFIMLFTPRDERKAGADALEPVTARNMEKEDILGEMTISRSTAKEVARTGKPRLLSRTDDDIADRQSVVDFRISSIICVPLAVKGRVLGIVYVDSRSGTIFTYNDLEFMISFADLAAIALENARLSEKLEKKTVYLQKQVESTYRFANIIGRSPAMERVFRMAESVAASDTNLVITGESGTGKELLARAIHFAGPRKQYRFQPVDCGAVTETILESELFGHVRGAFTGAAADRVGLFEVAEGGTIFLDEIANTSENFQIKLLRVLQEGEIRRVGDSRSRSINVRVIAATNKDLSREVEAGRFREDLYYRLNVVNIVVPPLRERPEDIPVLIAHFLERICERMKTGMKSLTSDALDKLLMYPWPGNVRQLENICERIIIFLKDDVIDLDDLPPELKSSGTDGLSSKSDRTVPLTKSELKELKVRLDRRFLVNLLEKTGGNVMQAARLSGMDRSQLHHMISRFGLNTSDFR